MDTHFILTALRPWYRMTLHIRWPIMLSQNPIIFVTCLLSGSVIGLKILPYIRVHMVLQCGVSWYQILHYFLAANSANVVLRAFKMLQDYVISANFMMYRLILWSQNPNSANPFFVNFMLKCPFCELGWLQYATFNQAAILTILVICQSSCYGAVNE